MEEHGQVLSRRWQQLAARDYQQAFEEYNRFRSQLVVPKVGPSGPEDEELVATAKLANAWLLGCDPEFVVINDKGEVVNTSNVLQHDGIVGWDHSGHVVEIRPEPSRGTYALTKKIQRVILQDPRLNKLSGKLRAGAAVKARLQRVDGMANARGERMLTLGGHIHLDLPPVGRTPGTEHAGIIKAMDCVTRQLEAVDILPKAESVTRRTDPVAVRNKYGQWGDWRPSGDVHQRTEYRVMASWLTHPWQAYTCLTLGKLAAVAPLVACEMLKGPGSYKDLQAFVEAFKSKDTNACRLSEKLFVRPIKELQFDPTTDFRQTWQTLGGL